MRRRYEMDNFLDPTPNITDDPTFGGAGTDPKTVLSTRLKGLIDQRGQIQRRSALNNTSPLGGTSERDAQDMVDMSQTIAALGQKVANPNKGIQFAPEPRISTTPNMMQAGWANDRAAGNRGAALAAQSSAASLDALNVGNARAEDAAMAAPGFGDVAGAKARYAAGANRRMAALGRQSAGGY